MKFELDLDWFDQFLVLSALKNRLDDAVQFLQNFEADTAPKSAKRDVEYYENLICKFEEVFNNYED